MPTKIALVLVAAAFLIACASSSTSQPFILDTMVLDEHSAPDNFTFLSQELIDNSMAANDWSDKYDMSTNYEDWGRIEGIDVEFKTGTGRGKFFSIIEVYKTEEGARQAFNFYRREGEPAATESFQEEGIFLGQNGFEDLEDPNIGDESFAVFAKFSGPFTNLKNMWTMFRQDNFVSLMRWRADFRDEIEASVLTDIAEQQVLLGIAQKQLELILR